MRHRYGDITQQVDLDGVLRRHTDDPEIVYHRRIIHDETTIGVS